MPGPEILDRSPAERLVDHGGADVGATRDRRRISEFLADVTHHRRNSPLRLTICLGRSVLGQCNRGEERPAPRAEVLGGELLAEVLANVVVQPRTREIAEAAFPLV